MHAADETYAQEISSLIDKQHFEWGNFAYLIERFLKYFLFVHFFEFVITSLRRVFLVLDVKRSATRFINFSSDGKHILSFYHQHLNVLKRLTFAIVHFNLSPEELFDIYEVLLHIIGCYMKKLDQEIVSRCGHDCFVILFYTV